MGKIAIGSSTAAPSKNAATVGETRCTTSPAIMAMAPPPLMLAMVTQTLSIFFSSAVVMLESHPPRAL